MALAHVYASLRMRNALENFLRQLRAAQKKDPVGGRRKYRSSGLPRFSQHRVRSLPANLPVGFVHGEKSTGGGAKTVRGKVRQSVYDPMSGQNQQPRACHV